MSEAKTKLVISDIKIAKDIKVKFVFLNISTTFKKLILEKSRINMMIVIDKIRTNFIN
jgi:hypothetical protein